MQGGGNRIFDPLKKPDNPKNDLPYVPAEEEMLYRLENKEEVNNLIRRNFSTENNGLTEYDEMEQLARFSDLTSIITQKIFTRAGKDKKGRNVFFLAGRLIPTEKKAIEKCQLHIINVLKEVEKENYIILYIHTQVGSFDKSRLNFIKAMFRPLPSSFYFNLEGFYFLDSTFFVRTDISLGYEFFYKFLKKKLVYVDNLEKLFQYTWFETQFCHSLPDYVFLAHGKEKKAFIESEINNKSEAVMKGVIGQNLSEMDLGEQGIPYIIVALTNYFEMNKEAFKSEGLFRVSGAISEEAKLIASLKERNYEYIYSLQDCKIVAGVFKKVFHEMPEPLIPFECYDKLTILKDVPQAQWNLYIKNVLKHLPKLNQKVLSYLLFFLNKVQSFQEFNKMGSYNLAVVFAPSLFRPKKYSAEDLIHASSMVACLKELISNYKDFLTDDEEKYYQRDVEKRKTKLLKEWREKEKLNEGIKEGGGPKELRLSDLLDSSHNNNNGPKVRNTIMNPSSSQNSQKAPTLTQLMRDSKSKNVEFNEDEDEEEIKDEVNKDKIKVQSTDIKPSEMNESVGAGGGGRFFSSYDGYTFKSNRTEKDAAVKMNFKNQNNRDFKIVKFD